MRCRLIFPPCAADFFPCTAWVLACGMKILANGIGFSIRQFKSINKDKSTRGGLVPFISMVCFQPETVSVFAILLQDFLSVLDVDSLGQGVEIGAEVNSVDAVYALFVCRNGGFHVLDAR